jgi:membrane protein DedA with SNARE-associated domain
MLPIVFLVIYIICFYAFGQYLFNDFAMVLQQLTELFNKYGALLVFAGGFIETLFLVGIYLPAGITIILGIILDPTLPNVFMVMSMCVLSAFFANIINFCIGKYGFVNFFNYLGAKQILAAQDKKNNSVGAILMSCVSPNILGITVVYHAMKGMKFYRLMWLSFLSTLIWVPILSVITLYYGQEGVKQDSVLVFTYFFLGWIAYLIVLQEVKYYLEKRKTEKLPE